MEGPALIWSIHFGVKSWPHSIPCGFAMFLEVLLALGLPVGAPVGNGCLQPALARDRWLRSPGLVGPDSFSGLVHGKVITSNRHQMVISEVMTLMQEFSAHTRYTVTS